MRSVGRALHRFVWHVEPCHGGVTILFRCVTRIQAINFFRKVKYIIYLTGPFDEYFSLYALFIFAWLVQATGQEFDDNVCVL